MTFETYMTNIYDTGTFANTPTQIALPLGEVSASFVVPFFDYAHSTIATRTINTHLLWNYKDASDDTDIIPLMALCEQLWQGVVLQFKAARQYDPALTYETILDSPGGILLCTNACAVQISIDELVPGEFDKWWGVDDFAKYGFFCTSKDGAYWGDNMTWLNFAAQRNIMPNNFDFLRVNLQPNLRATVTAFGELLPPSIIVTTAYDSFSYP